MLKDTIDAISTLLASEFKDKTIYVGYLEDNFIRPSLLVTYKRSSIESLDRWTYNHNFLIHIVYLGVQDSSNNPNAVEQYTVLDDLKKIFSKGYITVKDRAVKIREVTIGTRDRRILEITGGTKYNEVYLTLNLDVIEAREPVEDNTESIKEVKINLSGGNE